MNPQALMQLETRVKTGTLPAKDVAFASSLLQQAHGRGLSAKQWYWVEKLATPPEPKQERRAAATFARVYQMFNLAAAHLKHPKVRLGLPSGAFVKLYVSGETSRVPGVVNVVDETDDTWLGRVYPDGRWEQRRGSSSHVAEVEVLLARLAEEPEKVAAEYGKLTGQCCFCNRPLSDDRSTDVGYGPVCAKRYGLNWG